MKINEVELWREAFTYALDNHPNIDWPSEESSRQVHDQLIKAFVDGARHAKDDTQSVD